MNNNTDKRIEELYQEFKNFPSKNSIVRLNQKNDAFTLLVFEVLFYNQHNVKKLRYSQEAHRELLVEYIVPPPDDSIDIFFEETILDESKYHVVQIKNVPLAPADIEACFLLMENSIKLYLKKPKDTRKNLKEIIVGTDFSSQNRNQITYYVVHRGNTNYIRNQKPYQIIVTDSELDILSDSKELMCIPVENFKIDTANNFIVNNFIEEKHKTNINKNLPQSLLCNFNGYDLAVLNNKYSNTLIGRNILYGQNLRESLNKSSKTFDKMFETIDQEPDLFLYFNNGITIISSSFDEKNGDIKLENFSIINGAQTTSTLGTYLKYAEINNELEKIDNLKNVYVLTKIYQINKDLKNHEEISEKIKIYNNTQTPLSNRDMVSYRKEQIKLQSRFLECTPPNIYINIKKGVDVPSYPKTYPHQRISNEVIAQLALCAFFLEPYTAKDKKAKIFDYEGKEEYTLNQVYHKLFDVKDGILLKKSNYEIDELLFVYKLHEDTKTFQKNFLKEQITFINQNPAKSDLEKSMKNDQTNRLKRNMEISNVCLFFNITTYYEIKNRFDNYIKNADKLEFDYRKYYDDKAYREEMIKGFLSNFYGMTVEIIRKNSGVENVNNWIRSEKNQQIFLDALRDSLISEGIEIKQKYEDFVKKYKLTHL